MINWKRSVLKHTALCVQFHSHFLLFPFCDITGYPKPQIILGKCVVYISIYVYHENFVSNI